MPIAWDRTLLRLHHVIVYFEFYNTNQFIYEQKVIGTIS